MKGRQHFSPANLNSISSVAVDTRGGSHISLASGELDDHKLLDNSSNAFYSLPSAILNHSFPYHETELEHGTAAITNCLTEPDVLSERVDERRGVWLLYTYFLHLTKRHLRRNGTSLPRLTPRIKLALSTS